LKKGKSAAHREWPSRILKWARAYQCPWDEETCFWAAVNGHLELLKWAGANQCPCCQIDDLEFLIWARENGFPWDEETYENGYPALFGRSRMSLV